MPADTADALALALAAGHAALLAALVPTLRALPPALRRTTAVAGVGAAVALAVGRLAGRAVPTSWLSPVREGFTEAHLEAVAAVGLHAGPLVRAAWMPALLSDPPTLRAVVGLDLGATLAIAWLIGVLAVRRLGGAGLVLALAWLAGPSTWSAAFGETEASVVTLYGLLGLPALAVLRAPGTGRGAALAAAVTLTTATGLAAAGRPEVLALGAAALLAGLLARTGVAARLDDRVAAGFDRLAARPWPLALAAVAWIVLAERVLPVRQVDLRVLGQATWAVVAASPLHVRALSLPVVLVAALPAGLALLGTLGGARALRTPVASAGLPLVLLWWGGTWWLAGHGGLHGQARTAALGELWRYALLATPWVALLAIDAAAALPRRVAVALLLLPPLPWATSLLHPEPDGVTTPFAGPVRSTAAREVRALVDGVDRFAGCAIVTRGQPWDRKASPAAFRWSALAPWRGAVRVRHADLPADAAPEAVLAALQIERGCVVAWQGVDCGAVGPDGGPLGAPGCGPLTAWAPIAIERWTVAPWIHAAHGLRWPDAVEVGWRAFPGRDAGP